MAAFDKVLELIKNAPLNGHVLRCIENKKSLRVSKKEIEEKLKGKR